VSDPDSEVAPQETTLPICIEAKANRPSRSRFAALGRLRAFPASPKFRDGGGSNRGRSASQNANKTYFWTMMSDLTGSRGPGHDSGERILFGARSKN
jgi:hypothetical protein